MTTEPFDLLHAELDGMHLIEASAGTGKTWTLCGLYLRLLLERKLPVRQILVVTFTNAACAELRERVRARVVLALQTLRGDKAADADTFVNALLQRQLSEAGERELRVQLEQALQDFDEAAIFTIHRFCQRALADAPFSAGMPLQLELLGDDSELRLQVVHDFWRRRIAGGALTAPLAAHLLQRGDSPQRMAELLKRHLAKPLSRLVWPASIDDEAVIDMRSLQEAKRGLCELWDTERAAIVGIVAQALPRLNKRSYSQTNIALAAADWDTLLADDAALPDLHGLDKLALFTTAKLQPNKGQPPVEAHAFFGQAEAWLKLREQAAQALENQRLRLLRDMLHDCGAALRELKRQRHVVAFDDMLGNLHRQLQGAAGAALAEALRKRFPAVLIDEFQDTDPLQYAIFKAVHGDGRAPMFMVGDPKQAIYAFRNADLHTYLQARRDAGTPQTLLDNQRATEPLLLGLNGLFSANDRAFMLDGLDFNAARYGVKPRALLHDSTTARAALQLWALPEADEGGPLPKPQARQLAAQACAAEIARLIAAGHRGAMRIGDRALAAGDIAVLVRTHADGKRMRQALAAAGVGSVELSQASVFDSAEAVELECVLAAMLVVDREPLLRAALATELMGCDAGAIAALAGDEAGWLATLQSFGDWRDSWRQRGVGVMLRQWLQQAGVSRRLLAHADGERRLTNLLHLAECLHEAAAEHPAPQAQWRWLHTQRGESRADDATQLRLESDRNLVQILTIHRAKGLEYPFVFCPFLWDGSRRGGGAAAEPREYHDADGHAVFDMRARDSTEIGKDEAKAIDSQLKLDDAAERLRQIYVALTRAVQRCTVVVGNYGTRNSKHEAAHALLNWLVAGQGMQAAAWLDNKLQPHDIDTAWEDLARRHAPHVNLSALPGLHHAAAPAQPAPLQLTARAPPQHIAGGWWVGSYSALAHGAHQESAALDHDLRAGAAEEDSQAGAGEIADTDILRFARGSVAGECLHAVFERIAFDDPRSWPAAINAALLAHPVDLQQARPQALQPMLLQMLHDVLHTPLLGDGAALAAVSRARCLVELEFLLPSRHLSAEALTQLLQAEGYDLPRLHFRSLHGYLRGFIDLVFEHRGRFYLLDWKSNHLGDTPQHYGQPALQQTMREQAYHLQYLLYALALHRHLQRSLAGYRYDEHFGGVLYLFVRGVRPGWRDAAGRPTGVFSHRPALRTLQRIGALLGDESP